MLSYNLEEYLHPPCRADQILQALGGGYALLLAGTVVHFFLPQGWDPWQGLLFLTGVSELLLLALSLWAIGSTSFHHSALKAPAWLFAMANAGLLLNCLLFGAEHLGLLSLPMLQAYVCFSIFGLQGLLLSFGLLYRQELSQQQTLHLTLQANRSVKQMGHLLDNLLAWSRLQTEAAPFRPERFSIGDLARRDIELLAPMARHKDIRIQERIAEVPFLQGNVGMIDFVVRNLLHNAVKYTPAGGQVSLQLRPKAEGVLVCVGDQGLGITETLRQELLKGQEITSTTGTSGEKGSGMGLSLCRDFLRQHGCRLHIDSQAGQGSLFYFLLPYPKEKAPLTEEPDRMLRG